MYNIAITGGTGFLGSHICKHLIDNYDVNEIYAVVRNKPVVNPVQNKKIKYITQINEANVDCLIHTAWPTIPGNTSASSQADIHLDGYNYSIDTIKTAVKLGIKRMVVAGTVAEWGDCTDKITEETPAMPLTEYGKQKLNLFNWCNDYLPKYNVSLKWARCVRFYGNGNKPDTLISEKLALMKENKDILLPSCENMWNCLEINDAARAFITLATKKCSDGIYIISHPTSRKLKEYIYEMKEVTGSASRLLFGTNTGVNLDCSNEKLFRETGFVTEFSFKEGIKRLI